MRVYVLRVYDRSDFNRKVHESCWDTIQGARDRRDTVILQKTREDLDSGWDYPSYEGDITEMTVERSPIVAVR